MSKNYIFRILIIFSLFNTIYLAKYTKVCKNWDKVSHLAEEAKNSYSMICDTNKQCIGMNCEGHFGWEYMSLMKTHYTYSVSQLPCKGNSFFVFNLKVSSSKGSRLQMPGGYVKIITNKTSEHIVNGSVKRQYFTTFENYVKVEVIRQGKKFAQISMEVYLKLSGFMKVKVFNEVILPRSILPLVDCNRNIADPSFSKDTTFHFDVTGTVPSVTESPYKMIPGDSCVPSNFNGLCKTKGAICEEDAKCYCFLSEYNRETKSCDKEIIDGRISEVAKKNNKKLIIGVCVAIGLGSFVVVVFSVVCYKYRQFKRRYSNDEVPIVDDDLPIDA